MKLTADVGEWQSLRKLADMKMCEKYFRGGWPRSALGKWIYAIGSNEADRLFAEYLRDNGIVKNRTYPYVGKTDTCEKKHKLGQIPKLGNVVQFNLKGNETLLKYIVATEG